MKVSTFFQFFKYFRVMEVFEVPSAKSIDFGRIGKNITVMIFFGFFFYACNNRKFVQKPNFKKLKLAENAAIIEKDFEDLELIKRQMSKRERRTRWKISKFNEVRKKHEELKNKGLDKG